MSTLIKSGSSTRVWTSRWPSSGAASRHSGSSRTIREAECLGRSGAWGEAEASRATVALGSRDNYGQ